MSSSNDEDSKRFMRQYAAEIAKAFREQEEDSIENHDQSQRITRRSQISIEDSTYELYRSLCFDDPMIDTKIQSNISIVVSSLCRQLLATTSKSTTTTTKDYALSNRFVNGIIHVCQRQNQQREDDVIEMDSKTTTTNTTKKEQRKHSDKDDDLLSNQNEKNVARQPAPIFSTSMAKLTFCVLIQMPLQICQNMQNLPVARKFLGSYRGNEIVSAGGQQKQPEEENKSTHKGQSTTESTADTPAAPPVEQNGDNNDKVETGSLEEVWAAESDPSDYDYGEEDSSAQLVQTLSQVEIQEEDWLDPHFLSKADPTITIDQIVTALISIFKYINFSLLEPIFTKSSKKELESYMMELTQLVLLVLQPNSSFLSMSSAASNDTSSQSAMLSPLWLLRDAAILASTTVPTKTLMTSQKDKISTNTTMFIPSYLDLLSTLIAMDQAHMQDSSSTGGIASSKKSDPLCIASIVGLSSLSSWCSSLCSEGNKHTPNAIQLTKIAISEATNDLAHVVERAASSASDSSATDKKLQQQQNLTHTLVPIIEFLTGITYDQVTLSKRSSAPQQQPTPQMLLNSGLIRQLLSIAIELGKNNCQSSDSINQHYYFNQALWGLCVTYPTTIGKYSMRYPEFGIVVRQYNNRKTATDSIHSILWNLFGFTQLCGETSNAAPRVIWKSKTPKSNDNTTGVLTTPLTRDECEQVCQKAWSTLSSIVCDATKDSIDKPQDSLSVIQEWARLRTFMEVPYVYSTVAKLLDRTALNEISTSLSELSSSQQLLQPEELEQPSTKSHHMLETISKNEPEQEEREEVSESKDNDKPTDRDASKRVVDHHVVAAEIRKTMKQYNLLFEGTSAGSSKTD